MPPTKLNPNQVPSVAGTASGIFPPGTTLQYLRGDNHWATLPTTLPASDVYAWAKAATKPTYTYTEVGAAPAGAIAGLQQFMDNILYVSAGFTADGVHSFTTIATAITAWTTGKVILLAPETFSENVTLASAGMVLIGMSKYNTIIGNLTITGKDCYVKEITVSGDFENTCTNSYLYYKYSLIEDSILSGNVSIGNISVENTYGIHFFNCGLNGSSKTLLVNVTFDGQLLLFESCMIFSADPQYNLNIYKGWIRFHSCSQTRWYDFKYISATEFMHVDFFNCNFIWFHHEIETNLTNPNISVFYAVDSGLYKRGAFAGSWTFQGAFELDIIRCSWFYPNIVWNSTANSRITDVTGLGYASASTITGTGFNNLYIQGSRFYCTAPNLPIGHDVDNQWEAFLDG
jgi:hypothetical protein